MDSVACGSLPHPKSAGNRVLMAQDKDRPSFSKLDGIVESMAESRLQQHQDGLATSETSGVTPISQHSIGPDVRLAAIDATSDEDVDDTFHKLACRLVQVQRRTIWRRRLKFVLVGTLVLALLAGGSGALLWRFGDNGSSSKVFEDVLSFLKDAAARLSER